MKRALAPLLVLASLSLAACTAAPKETAPDAAITQPAPTTPAPAPTPAPPKPDTQPAPAPAQPAIKWVQKEIGYPLTSDDPAAEGKKVTMLTFDDGPTAEGHTARVLDTLKEQNIKAMFFITGYGAKNRDLVERIHREGHTLAVHSMTHANLSRLPESEVRKELAPLVDLIKEVTGQPPKYFRPPFGAYNDTVKKVSSDYGMELINWSHGSLDWEGVVNGYKDPQLVVDTVTKQMHKGAIILFHDTLKHTADALPEVVRRLKAEGYEFVVLP